MEYPIYLFDNDYDCFGSGCLSLGYIMYQLQQAAGQDVGVHISSCGGDAFQAPAVYNQFKGYNGNTTAYIEGIAASAAATAAMGCKRVVMSKYAILMIHPSSTFSAGGAAELASDVEMLKTIDANIVKIYMDKTGLPQDKVEQLVAATTWMDAEMALALGFIDEIQDLEPEQPIQNAALVMNYVQNAPAKYKQVINKILIKQPAQQAVTSTDMTDEQLQEALKPTNTLLDRVLNFFKKSARKVTTNKGDKYVVGNLAPGSLVYNDADMDTEAEDDDDMEAMDATGKKTKLKVKDGRIESSEPYGDPIEDDDDDLDADDKAALNSVGVKFGKGVTNKTVKSGMAKVIATNTATINEQNGIIADLRAQLVASNALASRHESEIRATIQSEFTPDNSKRSQISAPKQNATPDFLKIGTDTVAGRAAAIATSKLKHK